MTGGLFLRLLVHIGLLLSVALNHGELAALYCFVFLFIATQGSGKWALDRSSK